jgi:hypothetical protein
MKPKDLYSGPAPQAQAMMGQGLLEAGANIGRSIQSGYESLGKGIGAGIQAVGQAYANYDTAKASNKMTETLLGNEEMSKKILGISGQERVDMLSSFRDTIGQHGQMGGAQFSQKLLGPLQEYATIGRQYLQQQEMTKLQGQYNPGWTTAPAAAAYDYAKAEELQRQGQAASRNQATFNEKLNGFKQWAAQTLSDNTKPATNQPVVTPTQSNTELVLPENGIDLEHPTAFGNLSELDKTRVRNSKVGIGAWNAYSSARREAALNNAGDIIWNK